MERNRLFAVVYQNGIANLFEVDRLHPDTDRRGRTRRVHQGTFRECEHMSRGIGIMGGVVRSYVCDKFGDIAELDWSMNLQGQRYANGLQTAPNPVSVGEDPAEEPDGELPNLYPLGGGTR